MKSYQSDNIKLRDIYFDYTKQGLVTIAKIHKLPRVTTYKKQELIDVLSEYVLQKEIMERYFALMDDDEINAFQSIINGKGEDVDYDLAFHLLEGGYLGSEFEFVVPKDVENAYETFNNKEFHKKRNYIGGIWEYCETSRILYGVVPLDIIVKAYNQNEKSQITIEDLLDATTQFPSNRVHFVLKDNLLISSDIVDDDDYIELQKLQGDKPYYLPNKEEVKMYSRAGYSPMDIYVFNVINFLNEIVGLSEEEACMITFDIQEEIRNDCRMQDIFDLLSENDIYFTNDNQMQQFTPLIKDLWNNTRMLLNRGYTPTEFAEIIEQKEKRFPLANNVESNVNSNVIDFTQAKKNKIYPNSPCPCNSGLKYKHCCGKNN